jgi:hypothetical protein
MSGIDEAVDPKTIPTAVKSTSRPIGSNKECALFFRRENVHISKKDMVMIFAMVEYMGVRVARRLMAKQSKATTGTTTLFHGNEFNQHKSRLLEGSNSNMQLVTKRCSLRKWIAPHFSPCQSQLQKTRIIYSKIVEKNRVVLSQEHRVDNGILQQDQRIHGMQAG